MKHKELLPGYIQKAIDTKERLEKARALAWGEKTATEQYDAFYGGKSSLKDDADRKELNSWMEGWYGKTIYNERANG